MENKNNKKPFNKWLALINIPIQMGVIIFLFSYLGSWLDETHPNTIFYYHKIVLLVGVFLALYNTIRQVNEINKSDSHWAFNFFPHTTTKERTSTMDSFSDVFLFCSSVFIWINGNFYKRFFLFALEFISFFRNIFYCS